MGLLDVLQSASNAVAGNVAGPVDLLSFALRKAGIPIPEDALGGSEWMKRKGLMRDVPHGAEQVVGETLGLLAPTAIASNAPKIARGLLQMGENAAAPRTLNPETGAIVWHGSPHKFDRFDASKIGAGEGAQAYGQGIYLAERPLVAAEYIRAGRNVGFENWDDAVRLGEKAFAQAKGDTQSAIEILNQLSGTSQTKTRKQNILFAKQMLERGGQRGSLYKVELPDELIPRMLDWDKPLSQQPKIVQDALGVKVRDFDAELALLEKAKKAGKPVTDFPEYKQLTGLLDESWRFSQDAGADLYRQFGNPFEAAQKLKDIGIPGIRYLDGGSRGAGQGTSNYVIFPGLEDQLKILERNGVPLGLLNP